MKKFLPLLLTIVFIGPVPATYIGLQATIWPTPTTVTCLDEDYKDTTIEPGEYCISKPGNVREYYDELLSSSQFDAAVYRGMTSILIVAAILLGCAFINHKLVERGNKRRREQQQKDA